MAGESMETGMADMGWLDAAGVDQDGHLHMGVADGRRVGDDPARIALPIGRRNVRDTVERSGVTYSEG